MAFRSLARPSSPLYAKAFTVRPFLLYLAWLAQPPGGNPHNMSSIFLPRSFLNCMQRLLTIKSRNITTEFTTNTSKNQTRQPAGLLQIHGEPTPDPARRLTSPAVNPNHQYVKNHNRRGATGIRTREARLRKANAHSLRQ